MARSSSKRSHGGSGRDTVRRLTAPPYHVVKLGPMDTDEGEASMYLPIGADELLEPVVGDGDDAGLRAVMVALGSGPRTCHPSLMAAGGPLGFGAAETPEWASQPIAAIASRLHNAFTVSAEAGGEAWSDLLDALAGYVWNAPWDLWGDADAITVEVALDGGIAQHYDAAVLGSAGEPLGLALYVGIEGRARFDAAFDAEDLELSKRVPMITVTLADEPAWAVAAVEAAYGTGAAPYVQVQEDDGPRLAVAAELHTHAAAMCAIAALSPWVREVNLVRTVPDGPTVRVTARVERDADA